MIELAIRIVVRALLCVALIVMSDAPLVSVAQAQEPPNFFERLFQQSNKTKRVKTRKQAEPNARKRKKRRSVAAAPSPSKTESLEKIENARVVLVVGDFLAGGLAEGLDKAFVDSPGVRIVQRSNGSSGIVRDDYYNWQTQLPDLLDEHKPSALVVMIGANDRQDFRTTKPSLSRRSDLWAKEYEQRAFALAAMASDRNIPLVWVGMPAFRSQRMSSDMVAFNDVYRRAAENAGGEFVDIWDGFVNEAGAYVTSGPDINGQPARLRSGDGINITRAGKRKIAFYAEKPLRKILGDAVAPDIGTLGPENLPQLKLAPLSPADLERTSPLAFDDPELDGGTELLGAEVEVGVEPGANSARKLTIEGVAAPAKPGRVDDFSWKPTPPVKPGDDKTGSTKP